MPMVHLLSALVLTFIFVLPKHHQLRLGCSIDWRHIEHNDQINILAWQLRILICVSSLFFAAAKAAAQWGHHTSHTPYVAFRSLLKAISSVNLHFFRPGCEAE